MKLETSDFFLLCQSAISAAFQAGQIISKQSAESIITQRKKGGSSLASQVVTKVDFLCQQIILQVLMPTCERYELGMLTEESVDDLSRLQKDYFWCIDPLDGTLPFIEQTSGYAVSIALVARDGLAQIGVVYDPVTATLYHAISGMGAFRNGSLWKIEESPVVSGQSIALITDRSFKQHPFFSEVLAELKNMAIKRGYDGLETTLYGGAVMNACWVLENRPACYFKFPKTEEGGGSLWDYAATTCLFIEAGGVVNDIDGASLDLNRADSCFMNHRGVLYSSDQSLAGFVMELHKRLPLISV